MRSAIAVIAHLHCHHLLFHFCSPSDRTDQNWYRVSLIRHHDHFFSLRVFYLLRAHTPYDATQRWRSRYRVNVITQSTNGSTIRTINGRTTRSDFWMFRHSIQHFACAIATASRALLPILVCSTWVWCFFSSLCLFLFRSMFFSPFFSSFFPGVAVCCCFVFGFFFVIWRSSFFVFLEKRLLNENPAHTHTLALTYSEWKGSNFETKRTRSQATEATNERTKRADWIFLNSLWWCLIFILVVRSFSFHWNDSSATIYNSTHGAMHMCVCVW